MKSAAHLSCMGQTKNTQRWAFLNHYCPTVSAGSSWWHPGFTSIYFNFSDSFHFNHIFRCIACILPVSFRMLWNRRWHLKINFSGQVEFPEARIFEETLNILLYENTHPDAALIAATQNHKKGPDDCSDEEIEEHVEKGGRCSRKTLGHWLPLRLCHHKNYIPTNYG